MENNALYDSRSYSSRANLRKGKFKKEHMGLTTWENALEAGNEFEKYRIIKDRLSIKI